MDAYLLRGMFFAANFSLKHAQCVARLYRPIYTKQLIMSRTIKLVSMFNVY